MYFHRNHEQILMSASYTRSMQRNFKKDVLGYIKQTYDLRDVTLNKVMAKDYS